MVYHVPINENMDAKCSCEYLRSLFANFGLLFNAVNNMR